jgi:hypothetical protein
VLISSYFSIPNTYFLFEISRKLKLKIAIDEVELKFRLLAWTIQAELILYTVGASLYLYQAKKT